MGRDAAEAKRLKKLDELKKKNDAKNKGKAKKTAMKMDRESVEKRRMAELERLRKKSQTRKFTPNPDGKGRQRGQISDYKKPGEITVMKMFNDKIITKKEYDLIMDSRKALGKNMGGMMKKKSMGYNKGGLKGGQSKLDKNKDGKISGADFKMMNKGGMSKKGKSGYMYGGMTKKKKK